MWRSASSFISRRRSPQHHQRAVTSLLFERTPEILAPPNNNTHFLVGRTNRRCGCHPFTSSSNIDGGKGGDGSNRNRGDDSDSDDEEGWIPPIRLSTSDGTSDESFTSRTSATQLPKSQRIETILEVSRQVKEQERLDRALEESEQEAEALFQLSEEEMATLTDEEILERLDEALKREEELEEQVFQKELEQEEEKLQTMASSKQQLQGDDPQPVATDWLRNRRTMLGQDEDGLSNKSSPSLVPIIHHVLLKADEIKLLLEVHGGEDIVVIEDDPEAPRMGGAEGMIFCTGGGSSSSGGKKHDPQTNFINSSPYLISTLSRVLIDHMKDRKLHELSSIAPSSKQNTKNRAATSAPTIYGSSFTSPSESWRIVDCGNYIVHILDEATRWDLNLEDLWSGADPLWKLNVFDDDDVEDYCQKHPVPETFNGTGSSSSYNNLYGAEGNEGLMDGAAIKKLERKRFGSTRRHKPVIAQATKNQDRRVGKKKRREQRERDYFGGSSD